MQVVGKDAGGEPPYNWMRPAVVSSKRADCAAKMKQRSSICNDRGRVSAEPVQTLTEAKRVDMHTTRLTLQDRNLQVKSDHPSSCCSGAARLSVGL
jgi:hypothetical protein